MLYVGHVQSPGTAASGSNANIVFSARTVCNPNPRHYGIEKYYIGAASSGQVQGSKRKCGQSYADVSELPLSPRVREIIEAMLRTIGRNSSLPDQW